MCYRSFYLSNFLYRNHVENENEDSDEKVEDAGDELEKQEGEEEKPILEDEKPNLEDDNDDEEERSEDNNDEKNEDLESDEDEDDDKELRVLFSPKSDAVLLTQGDSGVYVCKSGLTFIILICYLFINLVQ